MIRHVTRITSTLTLLCILTISVSGQEKPNKCIMVFGAHADDVECIAGGTFARFIKEGYQGIYVCAINNTAGCAIESIGGGTKAPSGMKMLFSVSKSPRTYPVDALETIQIRQEESRNAAREYKAIPVFLNFSQPEIYLGRKLVVYGSDEYGAFNPPGRKMVSLATRYNDDVSLVYDLLVEYKPEIVITHTLGGEKLDHDGTAYMMYLAFTRAAENGIPVGKLWMTVNGWLLENRRGKPDVRIDVRDFLAIKYAALNKHLSQNAGHGREYVLQNKLQPKEIVEEFITVIDNTK